jgi:hypothetical protein
MLLLYEGVDDALLTHFYKWKAAEEQPTYAQIETLPTKIHIPIGCFFLKTPPRENLLLFEFRTVNSAAPQNLSRDMYRYLLSNGGNSKLDTGLSRGPGQ